MRPLDAVDLRILRELRFEARLKNTELAQRVGLSPTPCWNRVRALERDGVIQRYVTIVDADALGLPDLVFVEVVLASHDEVTLDAFGRAVVDLSEVVEAWLVSDEYDYLIKVAVAGSAGYERFLREQLFRLPGLRHTRSSFALGCSKQGYSPSPAAAPASAVARMAASSCASTQRASAAPRLGKSCGGTNPASSFTERASPSSFAALHAFLSQNG